MGNLHSIRTQSNVFSMQQGMAVESLPFELAFVLMDHHLASLQAEPM